LTLDTTLLQDPVQLYKKIHTSQKIETCKNSPTPGQEKRRAQFLGPGERGRNSNSRLAVPPGASSTVVSEHQNEEGELVGTAARRGRRCLL